MNSARFEQLLERTMGVTAVSVGLSAIGRAVTRRMSAANLHDENRYWELLQASPAELQELIEAVVVPETWFFRDPQAFVALAALAREKAMRGQVIRVLSLPCSTGEEPYTIAMTLLDSGLPAASFTVDAIDISDRSLAMARAGAYGRNSFRSKDLSFRDRYFSGTDQRYWIGDAVRAPVRFLRGNILDAEFRAGRETYDFVFCRNLLIYFDAATQTRAIGVLKRLLVPGGVLFAGHSETGLMQANGLVSARIPMAFAFTASTPVIASGPRQPALAAVSPRPIVPAERGIATRPSSAAKPLPSRHGAAEVASLSTRVNAPSLADLQLLADAGRLGEAAVGCERYLREMGPSAPVLLMLALIRDASGEGEEAARDYRRVLYLEPDNSEALGHLSLLLRKQGDFDGACLLDDRMRRHADRRKA
ncbi:MAG: chemotaxis protein CheR [Pseudomonas sp.]|uniref:CheR family methyltransferase n=1 Tax=Pseudomonas sp. TaxID=306 RepID=UPI0011F6E053|nr:protein-glutamate O-methyltransferase CheR [Pseudomonas sp.]RZI76422.1 MAG: chemotaxis protein CheR [Pseudomonas sp.]